MQSFKRSLFKKRRKEAEKDKRVCIFFLAAWFWISFDAWGPFY